MSFLLEKIISSSLCQGNYLFCIEAYNFCFVCLTIVCFPDACFNYLISKSFFKSLELRRLLLWNGEWWRMTQNAHKGKCKHIFACLKVHTNSPAMKLLRTETCRVVMHQHYQHTTYPLELFRFCKHSIFALFFSLIHLSVHKAESAGNFRNAALSSTTRTLFPVAAFQLEFSAANTGAEVTLQPLH